MYVPSRNENRHDHESDFLCLASILAVAGVKSRFGTIKNGEAARTRLLLPFPLLTKFLVTALSLSGIAYLAQCFSSESYCFMSCITSSRFTSLESSPEDGPSTLLRSWTRRWNGVWFGELLLAMRCFSGNASVIIGLVALIGRRVEGLNKQTDKRRLLSKIQCAVEFMHMTELGEEMGFPDTNHLRAAPSGAEQQDTGKSTREPKVRKYQIMR